MIDVGNSRDTENGTNNLVRTYEVVNKSKDEQMITKLSPLFLPLIRANMNTN